MKLERILVGCGLGEGEADVWQAALELARVHGSRVLPVHVLSSGGGATSQTKTFAREHMQGLTEAAREHGVDVAPPEVLRGKPATALLGHAASTEAAWIVIGAAERSTWARLLGTSAEHLCRESPVPTLVVRPGAKPTWKHVLCAVDGSPAARAALTAGLDLARTNGSKLTLLHVEVEGETQGSDVDEVMTSLDLHEVEPAVLTRRGKTVADVISAAQQETEADVLVVGTAGRSGLERVLHPNTAEGMLRTLPCSLVVTPAP